MTLAFKKQDAPQGAIPQQQIQIHIDRDTVNTASRQTSVKINEMTDQICREVSREIDKKK